MDINYKLLVGVSGRSYRYELVDLISDPRSFEGTFAVVALSGGVLCSVILVGQSKNLPFVARSVFPAQVHNYRATHAYVRENDDPADRAREIADIVAAYDPVANRA